MPNNNKRPLENTIGILHIIPYQPNLFLKAKVTAKTSMREWITNGRESQMFSCQLLDSTAEIRMTFFADQAKKFFKIIQVGKIYEIRYVKVNSASKQYNDLDHPYELNAVTNTTFDLDESTPSKSIKLNLSFENLRAISQSTEECCKDIIAIIKSFEDDTETYSTTKNMTYRKRDIELIDDSGTMISLTLWGDHATNFKSAIGDIIVIKRAKLTIYQGIIRLSTTNSSIIIHDYEGKEKKTLLNDTNPSVDVLTPTIKITPFTKLA
ncbi:hypothetical protein QAD02_013072 [Eretmocerus hayati]|uniref:Uncharacterized protein n=1 Tax=Eretmocerus hayati TaxID=131215 RepID=A0ACC2P1L1_9HYME|nr:hypothetical protein QAD02_013072 [Eretmocerus hayati]